MRRATLLATALLLLASPVWAAGGSSIKGNAFGDTVCATDLPCASGYGEGEVNIDSLAGAAANCVRERFAIGGGASLFDAARGLDSGRCLDTVRTQGGGAIPRCCLIPQPGKSGVCMLSCQAVNVR